VENEKERLWKFKLAEFVKMKRDFQALKKKESEELLKKKIEELEGMEAKAEELRKKGMCRVQFDPYVVKYRRRNGDNVFIRMNLAKQYPANKLRPILEDFKNSPLIEELSASVEIAQAMAEAERERAIYEKHEYDDCLDRAQEANAKDTG
jgi:hypothetical protein